MKSDRTVRQCRICDHKEESRIDIREHLMDDHTLRERLDALSETAVRSETMDMAKVKA